MADQMSGGCACGRVRYSATVYDDEAYLCHCRMCQRATGSISIAFKNVKQAEVKWDGEPDWYDSSPIANRPYCRECGTSLGFAFKEGSENMLSVQSLIWSLRLLSWLLIWLRLDQRNTPAPTDAAATAAAVIGLSLTVSIQSLLY